MEDAMSILLDELNVDRGRVIKAVGAWIEGQHVAAYHGSRLTEQEVECVRAHGLKRLRATDRTDRLRAILSEHPLWANVADQLEAAVQAYGARNRGGHREGQVHATLSQSGLLHGFNHYLTHGSELDQRVAHHLLDEEGKVLLANYGQPVIFRLSVPGPQALSASNPWGLLSGEMLNLVRQFLRAWSYWLAVPEFTTSSLRVDCGFLFNPDISPRWLVETEWVTLPGTASI
jgi:hypothetical protein